MDFNRESFVSSARSEEIDTRAPRLNGTFENLCVTNDHGEVFYPGLTTINDLNLNDTIIIKSGSVEVYPNRSSPPIGRALNRSAVVRLNDIRWRRDAMVDKLRLQGARCVRCDASGVTFEVEHFSKYGLNDSDEEMEITTMDDDGGGGDSIDKMATQTMMNNKKLKATVVAVDENICDISQPIGMTDIDRFEVMSPRQLSLAPSRIISMKASLFEDHHREDNIDMELTLKSTTYREPIDMELTMRPRIASSTHKAPSSRSESLLDCYSLLTSAIDWRSESTTQIFGASKYLKTLAKYEKSIAYDKSVYSADAACYMGRSFRVGWGPTYQLAHIGKPLGGGATKQVRFSLHSVNRDAGVENEFAAVHTSRLDSNQFIDGGTLVEHLKIQLEWSELTICEDTPAVKVKPGVDLLHAHASVSTPKFRQMFDLCVALWGNLATGNENCPDLYNHRDDRKQALSDWLMLASKDRLQQEIATLKFARDGYLQSVFSFLTGRCVEEACQLATDHGDWHLALLIAQINSSGVNRAYIKKQLENWRRYKLDSHIDKKRLQVYALLAGTLIWNPDQDVSVNCCENLDWKRALAVHLWYYCPSTCGIEDAVTEFERSYQGSSKYCQPPYPSYIENDPELLMTLFDEELSDSTSSTTSYDVCYHLLRLYCDRSTRLDKLVAPLTYTAQHLDYSNGWLLYEVLRTLGYDHLPAYQTHQLHDRFSTQLESMGLWHWSVFVALQLEDAVARKMWVMRLLHRHVQLAGYNDDEYKSKETFLVDELRIPKLWIYEAKAMRARSTHSARDEAWSLLKCGQWNKSHVIIMEHIAPDCVINENFAYLKQFLQELQGHSALIADWVNGGEVCLDYVSVCDAVDQVVSCRASMYDLEALQPQLLSLGSRICNLRCANAKETLCQSEMAKKTAHLLRTVLELKRIGLGRVEEHLLAPVLSKIPMPEDYALQELRAMTRSYMLELTEK